MDDLSCQKVLLLPNLCLITNKVKEVSFKFIHIDWSITAVRLFWHCTQKHNFPWALVRGLNVTGGQGEPMSEWTCGRGLPHVWINSRLMMTQRCRCFYKTYITTRTLNKCVRKLRWSSTAIRPATLPVLLTLSFLYPVLYTCWFYSSTHV